MSSIKLKHASGNGVIISAPSSNPAADRTLTLPSDADGIIAKTDTSGNLTVAGDLNTTNINGGSIGTKNLVDNGAMNIKQRSASSTNVTGSYLIDRFAINFSGTDEAITYSQSDVASGTTPYSLGFRKALKLTNGNQTGGADVADFVGITHVIESQNIASSGWNYNSTTSYISVSFWIKSSVSQKYFMRLFNSDGTVKVWVIDTGVLSANTWTKVTDKIPGHADLQFDNNNGAGLNIQIIPFYGTNYTDNSTPVGSWGPSSGSAQVPDMTTTWWTTNDSTFEITGFQIEVGPNVTNFIFENHAIELTRCQRYFQKLDIIGNSYSAQYTFGNIFNGAPIPYIVEMRTEPITITYSTIAGNDYWVEVGVAAFSANTTGFITFTKQGINFCCLRQTRTAGGATPTRREYYIWEPRFNVIISSEF